MHIHNAIPPQRAYLLRPRVVFQSTHPLSHPQRPVETLPPRKDPPLPVHRHGVRHPTRHLHHILQPVNQPRHVAAAVLPTYTKLSISVAPHSVDIAPVSRHKTGVLFAARDGRDYDVERADFWDGVDDSFGADA